MNNNKSQLREIILDTLTTGIIPARGDRMIEIACLEMIDKKLTGKKFHRYINPEQTISPYFYRAHGLPNEFLNDKPVFADISQELIEFLNNSTLVIYNAPFDMRFLNAELEKVSLAFHGEVVDTISMIRSKFGSQAFITKLVPSTCKSSFYKQSASLNSLCKLFNIDSSNRDTYKPLIDVELLAQVYLKLIED